MKLQQLKWSRLNQKNPISEKINKLKNKVKGESEDVDSAKLLNLQQRQKTVSQYVQEVEKLAKALEGAYINDGLTSDLAPSTAKHLLSRQWLRTVQSIRLNSAWCLYSKYHSKSSKTI